MKLHCVRVKPPHSQGDGIRADRLPVYIDEVSRAEYSAA